MPTRKDESIRSLTKTGGRSLGVTFPIDVVRRFGWKERQKLVVTAKGNYLIIKDWKR